MPAARPTSPRRTRRDGRLRERRGRLNGSRRRGREREVAGRLVRRVSGRHRQGRIFDLADRLRDRAPGAEPAAGRYPQRARGVTGDGWAAVGGAVAPGRRVVGQLRDGGKQPLGVGVPWVGEQPLGRCDLDDPAQVHDRDPVAEVPDDGQVVRDEQQGQAELAAQVAQQVQDRGLDADVQGRYRLVGHQDLGAQRQGPRDRHPLPLPAGELPGVGAQRVFPEPDQREQFLAVGLRRAVGNDVMHLEQLAEHAADGEPRVQRGVRVLENHLDPPLVGARPAGRQTPAVEGDLAAVGWAQPGQGQRERRLARTRLPDQGQRLASGQVEVDAVHGVQHPLLVPDPGAEGGADREMDGHILGCQQRPIAGRAGLSDREARSGRPGRIERSAAHDRVRSAAAARSAATASWQRS